MNVTKKQTRKIPAPSGPGFASTDDLVRRWQVSRNTVARLAVELGLMRSPLTDRPRWSWRSVWRAEGRLDPPPSAWPGLRVALLTPAQVARLNGYSDRTIRDRLSSERLPCIRLGPRIRRIDPAVLEALAEAAGEAVPGPAPRSSGDGARQRRCEATVG